jgi:hypothetical protein
MKLNCPEGLKYSGLCCMCFLKPNWNPIVGKPFNSQIIVELIWYSDDKSYADFYAKENMSGLSARI